MKRSARNITFIGSAAAAALAALWFLLDRQAAGGLTLTIGWLLLAAGFMQTSHLAKYAYTVIILAAVTISMTFPQYFITIGSFPLKKLIVPLLQIITFGVGCTMSWTELAGIIKMPKAVLIGVGSHYTIMPFVALFIARLFAFPPEIAAGVILVGCMPSGLASNVIAFIAKANLALSVTVTALSTLLSPLLTPLLMKWLGGSLVEVHFGDMLLDIVKLVILPILSGVLINRFFYRKALWIDTVMPKLSMAGIACIIIVITAAGRDNMLKMGIALVIAMFLHMTAGLLLGYWGGRLLGLSRLNARTIAIEVGMQNGGLASGIAAQMGKIATVGLAPAVNGPVMNTTFSLIATWWGKRPAVLQTGLTAILLVGLAANTLAQTKQPIDYVDNRIGVLDDNSNCVIGPQLPFGSINPSPQTQKGGDDGYDPRQPIRGFGQLQVSGTGWGTNGQIFLSPQIGLAVGETEHDSPKSGEKATPYEYSVRLDRYGIGVRCIPSRHSALYTFTFPRSDSASILLDLTHNIPMDIKPVIGGAVSEGSLTIQTQDHRQITGSAVYRGGFGGGNYTVYFAAVFSKRPSQTGTWLNGRISLPSTHEALQMKNDRVGAILRFSTFEKEILYCRIAVSYRSIGQAKAWLDAEIPAFDEDRLRQTARTAWNNALKKIEVSGGTERDKTLFYTAMYHAHLMPRDRTGDNRDFDSNIPFWDDHFAVWDTWRTLYPLHILINPAMVSGTINSFIARHKRYGPVRDAFINGNDMHQEQGGNNIDNIIADAYLKGIKGVDWVQAYQLLKYDADSQRLGSFMWRSEDSAANTYKHKGWIPAGIMSCSMTQEYAYNDHCIALVAKGLGKNEDYNNYLQRSGQWVNLWNKDAESDGFMGFIMPRLASGAFVALDAKQYPGSWKKYFYEGSSWTYSWFAPHDFKKLVALCGGKKTFADKLQYGFTKDLINYGNEPAFLAVQGFHYADRPDLSSYWVRRLMRERFTERGVPGNDDSGAMSAWYIFSAMGFFPNAGQNIYYLTGPLFKKIVLHMGNGKKLTITAPDASEKNIYIRQARLNGKKITTTIIGYDDLKNGGNLSFDMEQDNELTKKEKGVPGPTGKEAGRGFGKMLDTIKGLGITNIEFSNLFGKTGLKNLHL